MKQQEMNKYWQRKYLIDRYLTCPIQVTDIQNVNRELKSTCTSRYVAAGQGVPEYHH